MSIFSLKGCSFVIVFLSFALLASGYRKSEDKSDAVLQKDKGANGVEEEFLPKSAAKSEAEDFETAAKLLQLSAEQGDAEAQFKLGLCYSGGFVVKQDETEAVKWYRKAAEQGLAEAQFKLGLCYAYGEGVKQDFLAAARWCRRAADQGLAEAQAILAFCYTAGVGVIQDDAKAAMWNERAVEQLMKRFFAGFINRR